MRTRWRSKLRPSPKNSDRLFNAVCGAPLIFVSATIHHVPELASRRYSNSLGANYGDATAIIPFSGPLHALAPLTLRIEALGGGFPGIWDAYIFPFCERGAPWRVPVREPPCFASPGQAVEDGAQRAAVKRNNANMRASPSFSAPTIP